MHRKLKWLQSATLPELRVAMSAWCSFIWVHLMIRYIPYKQWREMLQKAPQPAAAKSSLPSQTIIHISEAVARNHVVYTNCLRRCLVQKRLLAKHGHSCQLHFGVKKTTRVEAHCWLSHNGQVINDSEENLSRYTPLSTTEKQLINLLAKSSG